MMNNSTTSEDDVSLDERNSFSTAQTQIPLTRVDFEHERSYMLTQILALVTASAFLGGLSLSELIQGSQSCWPREDVNFDCDGKTGCNVEQFLCTVYTILLGFATLLFMFVVTMGTVLALFLPLKDFLKPHPCYQILLSQIYCFMFAILLLGVSISFFLFSVYNQNYQIAIPISFTIGFIVLSIVFSVCYWLVIYKSGPRKTYGSLDTRQMLFSEILKQELKRE